MKKKVLIIGASGNLGKNLINLFSTDYFSFGTFLENYSKGLLNLDITDRNKTKKFIEKIDPSIIIIAASKTNVLDCELNPEKSYMVNVKGVEHIIENCEKRKVIYYSTDGVFDGVKRNYTEEDAPNPLNIYGQHKLKSEKIVSQIPNSIIIRSSRYYGFGNNKYLNKIIEKLDKGEIVETPINSEGNFTFIPDLVKASYALVKKDCEGIYHVAGKDAPSIYDAAIKIASIFGFDQNLIHPVEKDYFNKLVKRPSCPLSIKKLEKERVKMKTLEEGLLEIKKENERKKIQTYP